MLVHIVRSRRMCQGLCYGAIGLVACAGAPSRPVEARAVAHTYALEVPWAPPLVSLPRVRVVTGLANPRGMHALPDGSLLLAIAGTGDPEQPNTGALLRLRDLNQDRDFDDPGERDAILDQQPSRNLLDLVRRDEVFGMASVAAGGGVVLASLADFGGPSTIFRVDGEGVTPWASTHGNVNDLAYDIRRGVWLAVASTSDEIVQLIAHGHARRVVKIPPLASGQDSVPAYLRYDPKSGEVLVTLFSGSPEGEEGGDGVEIVPRSASIVGVHPETRNIRPVVTGLTAPTDLEIADDGSLYVLELCDAFVDPVARREDLFTRSMHGGFRRFSGRLLHIDRRRRNVTVIARGLDAPTNLERVGDTLFVAQGMGTPGRMIPGPDGAAVELTGFIERVDLAALQAREGSSGLAHSSGHSL